MTVLSAIDFFLISVILLLAFDALRKVTFFSEPLQTVAFVMSCCGAFGMLMWKISEHHPDTHWWALAMHGGIAIYAMRLSGNAAVIVKMVSVTRLVKQQKHAKR